MSKNISIDSFHYKIGSITMKRWPLIVCIIIFELTSSDVSAFDGQRKGFIIGGGLGGTFMSNKFSGIATIGRTEREQAILTEFKIGYAPTNSLEIYYVSKGSWYRDNFGFGSDATLLLGLSAVGLSKYISSSTGIFVKAGVGLAVLDAPFEDTFDSSLGIGLFGGVGYEFSKHWSGEIELLYSHISESGVNLDTMGVRVSLNVLAF